MITQTRRNSFDRSFNADVGQLTTFFSRRVKLLASSRVTQAPRTFGKMTTSFIQPSNGDTNMNVTLSFRTVLLAAGLSLGALMTAAPVMAEMTVMVGGAPMYPTKNIVENAVNSKDHTTLVAAVKAAGLVDTLASAGPFTVFAPTNEAFAKLPAGTVDTLLKPENKDKLTAVLTYHVVPGRLTAKDLAAKVDQMGGTAMLKTVQGEELTVKRHGGSHLTITDSKGDVAQVTIADVLQSNGVIHVINKVLIPG
jgi:uncharacterized surface protein with fasciclin (FAS1) repeats